MNRQGLLDRSQPSGISGRFTDRFARAMALHTAMARRRRCRDVLHCLSNVKAYYSAFNRNLNYRNVPNRVRL